jgi:hypothetical protein
MNNEYVPIKNNPNLSRHISSMGIINEDFQSKNKYINQRNKILEEKKVLSAALSEIGKLKQDLNELRQIVEKYINQKC